jgi:predicted PurR-regulated permease PerM
VQGRIVWPTSCSTGDRLFVEAQRGLRVDFNRAPGPKDLAMNETGVSSQWQRALVVMNATVVGAVAITVLYCAQSIFVPVALAAFLTFLLNPFVAFLRQRGLGRTPAVLLTVILAALALGGVGWLVTTQMSGLLKELPTYSYNVKTKVRSLKGVVAGSNRFMKMLGEINVELAAEPSQRGTWERPRDRSGAADERPRTLIVQQQSTAWLTRITAFLSPLLEYLGQLALAMILVVFMLQKREELRNRIIRLVGQGRVVATTKFVDEAGFRISRFLLMQAIVNGTFGLTLGIGLLVIGLKYAVLCGFLAAMLRYLPYIGAYLAAAFPITISLAMFDGWWPAIEVTGLFLALELSVSNAVEPWLYGQSMGVSEIALLVSAGFWAFLWGPIGLVLASPLTVCLLVLGRHMPQLEFLAVLLGDEPALEPGISFYQRLLAKDQDEAEDLILEQARNGALEEVYDAILVPALCATKRSRLRCDITEQDERYVLQAILQIADDLGERRSESKPSGGRVDRCETAPAVGTQPPLSILGAGHDAADRAALEVLRGLLNPLTWDLEVLAPEILASELSEIVARQQPRLVCIASIPPGGLARTRYLCKRLRARFPSQRIIVCRWGARAPADGRSEDLEDAGVDAVTVSLSETLRQLNSLFPVLAHARGAYSDGELAMQHANRAPLAKGR